MNAEKKMKSALVAVALLSITSCSEEPRPEEERSNKSPAERILAEMTLEEKIGQVIQADIAAITPKEAQEYNLGSVLNGGNSAPGGGVTASPEEWIALADAFWLASTDKSDGGVGIPLIWGTDAVHGHNNLQNATIFPHNSGLGAARNPDLIGKIGEVTAREIRATGLDWTFAPTLAVARDDRWGRAFESYSEHPEIVASYADAMVIGLQGESGDSDFLVGEHVVATAKHFVGDGGTQFGIDRGDAVGDASELLELHAAGYGPAIAADVQTVMASFSSINGEQMHGSGHYLTDILRGEMGFDGFVIGDWNGHGFVPGCTPTDCVQALEAGLDMYMAPDSWKGLYTSLLEHARAGKLDLEVLDRAVLRILRVKIRSGLFEAGLPSKRTSTRPELLGSTEHTAIARQAVRESLVLLKNENTTLPIAAGATILVTGSGADSMQQQTGGWTLSWQGDDNSNDVFETGETIFAGIANAVSGHGGTATYSRDGKFDEAPDVAIVVFGEQPYAEYRGDRSDLVFEFDDGENLELIKSLKAQGVSVVTVFLTGRPLWVNPHLNASDAFVVAWLPGTEGGGVADVLVGTENGGPRNDFKGRLSFSWPSDGVGDPINDAADPGILFPYGFGLTYASSQELATLSEDPGVLDIRKSFGGKIVSRGDAAKPFTLYLADPANDNVAVKSLRASLSTGSIHVSGADYQAQEDSRVFTWAGTENASVRVKTDWLVDLATVGDPQDLGLKIVWQVVELPEGSMTLSMGCGEECGATLNASGILRKIPVGDWATTTVPMSCFVAAGLKTDGIETMLDLTTDAKASIAIHSVDIIASDESRSCPVIAE